MIKRTHSLIYLLLFFISFLAWYFSLHRFFTGELELYIDANAFIEHIKYFLDQISRGVYPLWDPTRMRGVPNEFFLRRIGSYNPFYYGILILQKFGFSFRHAYHLFLAGYYYLGMVGFYFLAKRITGDRSMAFLAYLLLMFSSLVSLLFNSFIILVFTPMIWFFYFAFSFCLKPGKSSLLGCVFTLMLLMTTYIPFYFLTILLTFLICYLIVYFSDIKGVTGRVYCFVRENKFFVGVCTFILIFCLLPGGLFFIESSKGGFVLPARHEAGAPEHVLSVPPQDSAKGGIIAINFYHDLFSNHEKIKLGNFYIPLFTHILFLLGFLIAVNRKIIMICFWGLLVYAIGVYGAGPLYKFLYQYVFFFKYFRNFQFFLWLVILPCYILLCVMHLASYSNIVRENLNPGFGRKKILGLGVMTALHAGAWMFLLKQEGVIVSSYVTVALSYAFFILHTLRPIQRSWVMAVIFILIVCIQPIEVNHYLQSNTDQARKFYRYEKPYLRFIHKKNSGTLTRSNRDVYFLTKSFDELFHTADLSQLEKYLTYKLYLYETSEGLEDFDLDNPKREPIEADSSLVQVKHYDVNSLVLTSNLPKKYFLVYNDSYYDGWKVRIDDQEVELKKSNIAFKGVWLPAGEHEIVFLFGSFWQYVFNYLLVGLFMFVLFYLVVLILRERTVKCSTK